MGKIYENKELMKKVSKTILKTISEKEGWNLTDEQIEERVEKIVNNEEKIELHKKALEIKEALELKRKIGAETKESFIKNGGTNNLHGFERVINFRIDTSDTPEASEANYKLYEHFSNETFARNEISNSLKQAMKTNNSKYFTTDYNKLLDIYKENTSDVMEMLTIDSTISNGHRFNPKIVNVYNENKSLIETAGDIKAIYEAICNPCFLLVDDIDSSILLKYDTLISGTIKDMVEGLDNFEKDPRLGDVTFVNYARRSYAEQRSFNRLKEYSELYKKYNIPNLGYEYKATLNGESLILTDALEKLKNGENVKFEERTEEEIEELDHLLDTCLIDKTAAKSFAKATKEEIKELYENIKALNLSDNSPEYENLVKELEDFVNNRYINTSEKEIFEAAPKLKDVVDDYISKRINDLNDDNLKVRYDLCVKISDKASLGGKTVSDFCNSLSNAATEEEKKLEIQNEIKGVYKGIQEGTKDIRKRFSDKLAQGGKLRGVVHSLLNSISNDMKNAKADEKNRFIGEAKMVALMDSVKAKLNARGFFSKLFHPFRTWSENNVLKELEALAGPTKTLDNDPNYERNMSWNEVNGGSDNLNISKESKEMYIKIEKGEYSLDGKVNDMPQAENPIANYVLKNETVFASSNRTQYPIEESVINGMKEIDNSKSLDENVITTDVSREIIE